MTSGPIPLISPCEMPIIGLNLIIAAKVQLNLCKCKKQKVNLKICLNENQNRSSK
jgi:hypothetical protein